MRSLSVIEALRSGAWLTTERLRFYPRLVGGLLLASMVVLIATSSGVLDYAGRPIGTDFSQVWVAGQEVLAGHPAQPYDNIAHAAAQSAVFGAPDGWYSWPYPPYFLGVAALAATMPYLVALALWQASTLILYLSAILRIEMHPRPRAATMIGLALAFPAVSINLEHGHNGFLTAGLLAWGAHLVPRRPVLGGVLLGLLVYKPQLALVIPVALGAGGLWRAAGAAAATAAAATLATIACFGWEPWSAFFDSLTFTRTVVLEAGGPGFAKMQSLFAAVRLVGGSVPLAYAIQAVGTAGVVVGLGRLWHSRTDHRLKVAGLLTGSLLATPYCMDYDMVALGPAIAAMLALGCTASFAPFEKTLLAVTWAMPLVARPVASSIHLPLGICTMLALFVLTTRGAVARRQSNGARQHADASGVELARPAA